MRLGGLAVEFRVQSRSRRSRAPTQLYKGSFGFPNCFYHGIGLDQKGFHKGFRVSIMIPGLSTDSVLDIGMSRNLCFLWEGG